MQFLAAAVNTQDLGTLGVPGLVVIVVVLASVLAYREVRFWPVREKELISENKALQSKIDGIQETRLQQAIETRDKLAEPMQNMTNLMQNILNAVTRGK